MPLGFTPAKCILTLVIALLLGPAGARFGFAAPFTPVRLIPLQIKTHAPPFAGGGFDSSRLIDEEVETEYASDNCGTNTFVEFQFEHPTAVVAFRHLDRADRALVGASELIFTDDTGEVGRASVTHVDRKSGETFFVLPCPIKATGVRWRVTQLGRNGIGTVGGAEIGFYAADAAENLPTRTTVSARALPFAERGGDQPVTVTVDFPYLEATDAIMSVGRLTKSVHLVHGRNTVAVKLPVVSDCTERSVELELAPGLVKTALFQQQPVRPMTVYILPHSHTDIGYTELQSAVEEKQVRNLVRGIELARRTASYPEGARYVWNVEVLWAADLYLRRLGAEQRADFFEAIKRGQVELNGMYLNELTALCRPEELIQLFRYANELGEQTGKPVESAMISDVTGCTWGTVTAMAQAGLRYLSCGPNYGERAFMRAWADKPFYWVGPDGKSKVLVWVPFQGYALSHIYDFMSPRLLEELGARLQADTQPYDVACIRWAGQGDNGVPDASICDFVLDWNATYVSPRLVISGTTEAFRALEERYGSALPIHRGDWTPYWEDGAGSSAHETAMNRQTADRLGQAQTLFAMFNPAAYPKPAFDEAWRNVLLYSEHTWGAAGSVSQPEHPQTVSQWAVKKGYADQADEQSRSMMNQALQLPSAPVSQSEADWMEVVNTLSWERTELVLVPPQYSTTGDRVVDESGRVTPSQRLRSGELAFLARAVPPFATAKYRIEAGAVPSVKSGARIRDNALENGVLCVRVDKITGGIIEFRAEGIPENFAGEGNGEQLNEYLYLRGDRPDAVQTNERVRISEGEIGPLVASLVIESAAPGCRNLRRELRLTAGRDFLEVLNCLDKARLEVSSYKSRQGKESVNFAFPLNIPNAAALLDIPLGAMRPDHDQLPVSCKGWFTVGRWVNIENEELGMTWVTLDAPLIQFGDPAEELRQWRPGMHKNFANAQRLHSWVMNNRWGTNYKAYQEGPTVFRYVLRPYEKSDTAATTRFATGFSQPLIAVPLRGAKASGTLLPVPDSSDVVVTAFKPADDRKGWIIRLFGASGHERAVSLDWGSRCPLRIAFSDTSEKLISPVHGKVTVPGFGIVTLRAEFE